MDIEIHTEIRSPLTMLTCNEENDKILAVNTEVVALIDLVV